MDHNDSILITGGCGFIGSHFARFLLEKYPSVKVINIDKLTYAADRSRLLDVENNSRYRFIRADVREQATILEVMKKARYVVHLAAETHVDNSIRDPEPFINANILGTYQILECLRRCPNVERFVQISTDEVYGPILEGQFSEDAPMRPSNPYSASKAAGDSLAHSYYVTYRLPMVITRATNNYGPGQFPEKVIPVFVKNALHNKPLPVYGDGLHKRRWLHVLDHCQAIDLVMRLGKLGSIYNVAGDTEITNRNLAKMILDCLGKPESLIQYIEDSAIRPGHDRRYALNDSKIRRELGWTSAVGFEEGLRQTVMSYVTAFAKATGPSEEGVLAGGRRFQ